MKLRVEFKEDSTFCARFVQTNCTFRPDFGEVVFIKSNDIYDGTYNVIPRVYQQVLPTKDKVLIDDVTVEVIPLTTVLNLSDGYTATIG